MEQPTGTIFTIGDVVTLKLKPEFSGVIVAFLKHGYGKNLVYTNLESAHSLTDKFIMVELSSLDMDFKSQIICVPILHLKFPE